MDEPNKGYVAYVNNYKGDYIINIDGDQYKIEI